MKRVTLALAFLVVAGTASAAIFNPPSTLEVTGKQAAKISPPAQSSAPLAIQTGRASAPLVIPTGRAPVPLPDLPKPPPLDIASLVESPAAAVRTAPPPRVLAPRERASLAIERATERDVGNLSDARCRGRSLKSITVLPDGSFHVQC